MNSYSDYTTENWRNKLAKRPAYDGVESEYKGEVYHHIKSDASYADLYYDGHAYPWVVAYRDDSDKLYQLWFDWNPDEDARTSGDGEAMVADWYHDVFDTTPITDDEDDTVCWLNYNLLD